MSYKASKSDKLIDAARQGRAEDVRVLMRRCSQDQNSDALRWAAYNGHTECLKLLIPLADPKYLDSDALRFAARGGHVGCVELLIPVSDPATDNSVALVAATMNGHLECVRVLLPVSNPKDNNSLSLQWASQNNHLACFDLLYPFSDPVAALNDLRKHLERPETSVRLLRERIEAELQHTVIANAIGSKSALSGLRKI